jgi:hypothetical protein
MQDLEFRASRHRRLHRNIDDDDIFPRHQRQLRTHSIAQLMKQRNLKTNLSNITDTSSVGTDRLLHGNADNERPSRRRH